MKKNLQLWELIVQYSEYRIDVYYRRTEDEINTLLIINQINFPKAKIVKRLKTVSFVGKIAQLS